MLRQRRIAALNAVTATTISKKFWVGGASRIAFHFRRANHSAGESAFTIKGSLEPFEAGNATADSYGNPTGGNLITMTDIGTNIVESLDGLTLSANGDTFAFLAPQYLMNWVEITVTETTDGTHSAWIVLEEELPQMAGF